MVRLEGKRVVVFAEGCFGPITSKVATSYLRYRHSDCVAVVDSRLAGQDVGTILGYGHGIPVVASLESALRFEPEILLIGVGLFSNELPQRMARADRLGAEPRHRRGERPALSHRDRPRVQRLGR